MSLKGTLTPMKTRDSNMELLRIVAMLMVLIIHADYMSLGSPTGADTNSAPIESFIKIFVYSLTTVCVNCFVLLSGWYGLRPKIHRFAEIIFQMLFLSGISLFCYYLLKEENPDIEDIKSLLLLTDDLWFIRCYIILYLLSPLLNSFSNVASKRQFQLVLGGLFAFQTIYGWAFASVSWFDGGYSPLSFMLLYLISQYMRHYPSKCTNLSSNSYIILYLCISALGTVINFTSLKYCLGEGIPWLSYISPIVILNSIILLLFFSKLKFKNKAVNWIANSCFAVYIIQCSRHILDCYCNQVGDYYYENNFIGIIILIMIIFIIAVLLDKIRIWGWNLILCKK